ncbi:hypothetical protein [Dysgonomonas sp. HGC4]|uniref:hypothetical protein n=1 Tax=Dysgonomonas sp. HGC4 TaxID=1658009 RepID=UPI000A6D5A41|nr:hypothetical protein [Dysgonomonas sp. HGC4]MBD8346630.1 hypothetical protein [Dysgonomonas sp. HGC4]
MNKLLLFFAILFFSSLSAFSANYYWVGGSGNWSDINHWRTSSGGAGIPGVVPGPTDDVFFDANSGFTLSSKTIALNVPANCRNITFAGAAIPPLLTYSSTTANALNIYGSSVWQAGMTVSVNQINYQDTGIPKTITSNGVTSGSNVYLFETSSVSLVDNFKISTNLIINAGIFNTNNNRIDVGYYFHATQSSTPKTLNLGSSDIYINSYYMYMNSASITLNAGTSTIHFMGTTAYLYPYEGQVYYNVVFENEASSTSCIQSGGTATKNINFNRVEFKGDGLIYGYNTFKEMIFSPGKTYLLGNNVTQTITGSLSAESECVGWLPIQSSTAGSPANLSMPTGAEVKVSGAVLTDIKASGGATFTANNSIDNGGNTGWNFIASASSDLYWVGGTGVWNDPAHWSLTSGGVGGACVPSPSSNVFFDANSGFTSASKTITVNGTAYCRNITFSGAAVPPTVTYTGTASLNIYGSSVWQQDMIFGVYTINYKDTGVPKTITSNGVSSLGNNVYFYETSSISLTDNYKVDGTLYLYAGTFNTNNNRVEIGYAFYGDRGTSPRTLNLGSSEVYISNYWYSNVALLTLNAGTSHIHFKNTTAILYPAAGQVYNDVTFEHPLASTASLAYAGLATNNVRYNRVEFKGLGAISGHNTFKDLIFAPGKNYTMQSASNQAYTQTITGVFSVESDCLGWAAIQSTTAGYAAVVSMPVGALPKVSGVMMKDIKAIGGASFVASNSIDNGGNTGWNFATSASPDLYWVGGSGVWNDASHWSFTSGGQGGACVPSPNSNVFFDAGSGFTSASKTVTIEATAYCRNITCAGAVTPPTLTSTSSTSISFNIYGSSVWQSGMTMSVYIVNYQNTGIPKTITSNGVKTGTYNVYIYETSSISLVDELKLGATLSINAGVFNTNNNRVEGTSFYINSGIVARTLNLGSSDIYFTSSVLLNSQYLTVNAGTSHIHLTGSSGNLSVYAGQIYNNVTFENASPSGATLQSTGTSVGKEVQFNRVEFKGTVGSLSGHNMFNQLFLTAGGTYTLSVGGDIQTVKERLTMSGNTCLILFVKSSTSGTQANLKLLGGRSDFNFVNIKDINATGGMTLHFRDKSTVAGQNNTNITYDAYNSGEFNGFPSDWTCHFIDADVPASYTLTADGFFGTEYTEYVWTKIGDPNFTGTISTASFIDLRTFGYGTYRVQVKYNATCIVTGTVLVVKRTDSVDAGVQPSKVCQLPVNTLANVSVNGENIKWYATAVSAGVLPLTTVLVDGATYYVTQTKNNCESGRVPITIKIGDCTNVYVNPNLRMRVPM